MQSLLPQFFKEFKPNICVELTDFCNQNCIMCRGLQIENVHGPNSPADFMNKETWDKIIADLIDLKQQIGAITPYWFGEALLHPEFPQFINQLFEINKRKRIFYNFCLATNATLLTENISDIFLDYAKYIEENSFTDYVINIRFSLDAVKNSTYKKIKKRGNLDSVIKNIKYLVEKRKRMGLKLPSLTFGYVILKENRREIRAFKNFWSEYLTSLDYPAPESAYSEQPYFRDKDAIFFSPKYGGGLREYIRSLSLHRRIVKRNFRIEPKYTYAPSPSSLKNNIRTERQPCYQLWRQFLIAKDGTVVPCCRDQFFELKIGNIKEQSLSEILSGDKLRELRMSQIKGEFNKFDICTKCEESPGGFMDEDKIETYLKFYDIPMSK